MLAAQHVHAAPYRPSDPGQVLEQLPASLPSTTRRNAPALSPSAAASLARQYIEQSRVEGDPRGLGYAEGVLAPWWTLQKPPPSVLLMRATIRQSRHDFVGALTDLGLLLKEHPDHAQAWLTQATVLRVLGRYPEAAQACRSLQPLTQVFIAELCRLSVAGLSGALTASYPALLALDGTPQSQELESWLQSELAEMAERAGQAGIAEQHYRRGLAADPNDHYLRAAYADLLLSQKRASEAAAWVKDHDRVDALRLRHALALKVLGDPGFAAVDSRVRDDFKAARRRGEALHLREEALYALDARRDLALALHLAQQNWAVQHEPVDALLLVRAATAAGQPAAADPVWEWMRSSGLQDARIERLRP